MKTRYYYIIIFFIIISGGFIYYRLQSVHYNANEVVSLNDTRPIDELKKLVLSKGDTLAYKELRIAYFNVEYYEQEYLIYSIIMADKYKFPRAYYYVYLSLTSIFERYHYAGKIDEKTRVLAIKYLKEGVELNDKQSTNELSKLYEEGKYVPKDTVLSKKLLEKEKSCW